MENHSQSDDHRRSQAKARRIHRVLPQLRRNQHAGHVYDPIFVSLGPYHHGRADLQHVQDFKPLCLDWLVSTSQQTEAFYYNKIKENIDAIRDSYAEAWILEKYDDDELARMMLLDGCTIINYMATRIMQAGGADDPFDWESHLGLAAVPLMVRDMVKVENQLPFKVIRLLLVSSRRAEGGDDDCEWDELIHGFLRWLLLRAGSEEQISVAGEYDEEDPPLHILEAIWRAVTGKYEGEDKQQQTVTWDCARTWMGRRRKGQDNKMPRQHSLFGSAMDLKARGIGFGPSTHSLRAIAFESHLFHGRLKLPIRFVSDQHQAVLSNLIAYELSPESKSACTVLSYAAFMKALIERAEDVKELQESGILYNKYSNHEQVVESFKEIDTLGMEHLDVFNDVKEKIGEHCKSRLKTWMATLVVSYFCSPWRVISLSASTSLLVFAFLQAFYAVRGGRSK